MKTKAKQHQQKVEDAHNNLSTFTEQSREHYVKNTVSEYDQQDWTAHLTDDELFKGTFLKLLPAFAKRASEDQEIEQSITSELKPEPLPTPIARITKLDQLSSKIARETDFCLTVF